MTTLCQVTRYLSVIFILLMIGACGDVSQDTPPNAPQTDWGYVRSLAQANGIPERVLFTVAQSQSQMGTQSQASGASQNLLLGPQHNDYFGFKTEQPTKNFRDSAKEFVKLLKEKSNKNPPKKSFDWLLLSAKIIVGESPDINTKETATGLVLQDLIRTHNQALTVWLPMDEVVHLDALPPQEAIQENQMNLDERRYFTDFKLGPEPIARIYAEGQKQAVFRNRLNHEQVTIEIRWCPAHFISCFEQARTTIESPTHFLYFKNQRNNGELVQFHSLKKDLNWYGSPLENTISLTFVGFAGMDAKTFNADWFDWEDYVSIARFSSEIMAELGISSEELLSRVREKLRPDAPEGKPHFVIPKHWDSMLFKDILLSINSLRDASPIKIESPQTGQVMPHREVTFRIYPGADNGGTLSLYQDTEMKEGNEGKSWDLITKTDLSQGQRVFQVAQRFERTGLSSSGTRAVKCEVRDNGGKLLGTRIVKFIIPGLAKKLDSQAK